jgi:anti-sigma regulatory factor (Ser/Thr protein kinase)
MKDLSLHVLDIVQNALAAGAEQVRILVEESVPRNCLVIAVEDNGKGMSQDVLDRVTDPYFTTRTTRKVGLGIPLLKQNAEQCGGGLLIESAPGRGTRLVAEFVRDHIDRPALGDMPGVVAMLSGINQDRDFIYHHRVDERDYCFDTREVKQILEGVPLGEASVMRSIREMIGENLKDLEKAE